MSKLIGIRMIMAEAKEVRYTTLLHLNNLIICISPKDTKEGAEESSQ